ncbi:FAD-dependent oxidoreductase [Agrobacterium vitis]|uniref:FAD-dependent oxidoreductase n=1 Tax=Agrobacterium vitis TaxID=373 RepID=UPI001573B074|nr:FAD-dependent oxidoreductase [Agrobacterium vitis]NSZ19675.1 FAD-dependent oxidoreductase [Agrobacterium vitis]QZO06903.1 FAD-dependent oxidoreductase [Agrobacterium vitis]UJL91445.1 FAD-dependent oxidoreductase [Agrobacterium vitis]
MTLELVDIVIIGAGPAGMSAAVEAHKAGLSVTLVDEGAEAGGQVYRSVLNERPDLATILGPDYVAGRQLAKDFCACGATYLRRTTAFMIERAGNQFTIGISASGQARFIGARFVIIATGALERPFPIKGWTLPGVMTAGAAQTMLKASGTVPCGRTCLAGCGPLLYLLAAQYIRAGVELSAVLDTTPWSNTIKALPFAPAFLVTPYFRKGIKLMREVQSKVRVVRGVSALEAVGENDLTSVKYTLRGKSHTVEAKTLLLHQGVVPQVNLAMSIGVKHDWNGERLAFEPSLDACGQTSVAKLFIAGDSGGIGGAEAASCWGKLAVMGILKTLDAHQPTDILGRETAVRKQLRKAGRGRRFLDKLYRPAPRFRIPADDVIVCRCEEVRAGEIRAITVRGAKGPNQAKAFSRAGMGPCQGRMCGLTVCEMMSDITSQPPSQVGYMNIRAPVKPVTLGEIAVSQD